MVVDCAEQRQTKYTVSQEEVVGLACVCVVRDRLGQWHVGEVDRRAQGAEKGTGAGGG